MKYTFTEKKDTRSGFGVGLHELGKKNGNVVALCADLTGSLKMDAFKKEFPDRFFQVGIAEANMMGIAAGMTIGGKIPFTGTFANFSTGRIAARYRMAYTPEVLAEYRKHHASISGRAFTSGQNMTALRWVMEQVQQHLPAERRSAVMTASRLFYAHYALRVANALWKKFKDRRGASAQAMAAWNMSRDAGLFFKIVKLYTRITLNL